MLNFNRISTKLSLLLIAISSIIILTSYFPETDESLSSLEGLWIRVQSEKTTELTGMNLTVQKNQGVITYSPGNIYGFKPGVKKWRNIKTSKGSKVDYLLEDMVRNSDGSFAYYSTGNVVFISQDTILLSNTYGNQQLWARERVEARVTTQ